MNCNNCGNMNNPDSKFCVKCGQPLSTITDLNQNVQPQNVMPEQPVSSNITSQNETSINNTSFTSSSAVPVSSNAQSSSGTTTGSLDYLSYAIAFMIKPFQAYKEEEGKISDTKSSFIFAGIVATAMMIINFIITLISAVFVKKLDSATFKLKTTFSLDGLKDLDYVGLIFKNLIIYAVIILVIAAIYYIASLIIKKQISFGKFLSATASSMIPFAVISMFLSNILGKIWMPLSIIAFCVGAFYSLASFFILTNEILGLEDNDLKIKLHAICMSVLVVGGGYALYKILLGSLTSGLGSLSSLLY